MMKNTINIEHSELTWLDENHYVTLNEIVEFSGLSMSELQHLVESGVLVPVGPIEEKSSGDLYFSSHSIISIRTLSRLKQDFELEQNALSLMLVFLERIRMLEYKLSKIWRPIQFASVTM